MASLHFSGFKLRFGNPNMRPAVGTSFYLVPSFAAFPSLFDHLCSCFPFFSSNNQSNANCQNFDSMQWRLGETSWAFLKTECVHLSDLHTVQQSSQMSHVMWIACNSNVSRIISVYKTRMVNLKASVRCIPKFGRLEQKYPTFRLL